MSTKPELKEVAQAVVDFLSGPKDRFGRVDVGANDQIRDARERIRQYAVKFNVTGSSTYIDQCAAVLRAALERGEGRIEPRHYAAANMGMPVPKRKS